MPATPTTHPTTDLLLAYGQGKLDGAAADAVAKHLDSCAKCCREVAALSGDSFVDRLRAAHGHNSTPAPAQALTGVSRGVPAVPDAPPDLPPELRNHPQYEVVRELGRGGMGVVYLATNKLMQRPEVLKVMNKALLDHSGASDRFLREIRAAAKLNHPNIATGYAALQEGELLVFAMEHVEGQDLAKVVKARKRLPVMHACHYARQVALGLQHAYENGTVHRDIKPQNLMLTPKGQVKILDFGLAKLAREQSKADAFRTQADAFMGTPDYVAPEQATDARTADIRADIYSLGCTLYMLLAGRPPFKEDTLVKLVLAHIEKEAPPLHEVRPDVPEELSAVVAKMLAKAPAERYQEPKEVAAALAPFSRSGAKPAGAESSVKPAASARQETQLERSSVVAEGLKEATHRTPRPSATKPAVRKWWPIGVGVGVAVLLGLVILGVVIHLKNKDGTNLVVEVNEPNADVFVDGEKVTVTWDEGGKKAEIRVRPGTRKVEVKKDGITILSEEVEIEDGKRRILTARLRQPVPPPGDGDGKMPPNEGDGFVSLFNGKDLKNWNIRGGRVESWRIQDGVLVGRPPPDGNDAGGWICFSKDTYRNFRLRVETTLCENWNCALLFLWLEDGNAKVWYKAMIGTPSGRDKGETGTLRCGGWGGAGALAKSSLQWMQFSPDEWFTLEVEVRGNRIISYVNGKQAALYESDDLPKSGHIGIGRGGNVRIRKIEIKELPK